MISMISWKLAAAGAIKATKATQATNLMVFPAVPDHSRPLVRLAFICRPRLGFRSIELAVRSLRHLPMNSLGLSTRLWDKPPPDPDIANGCRRSWLLCVVHGHRAVMRWRQPRSIHLCDEHGCVQLADAGGETTRAACQEEYRKRFKSPQRDQYRAGKTRHGKSPMTRSKPLGPCYPAGKKHQRKNGHSCAAP